MKWFRNMRFVAKTVLFIFSLFILLGKAAGAGQQMIDVSDNGKTVTVKVNDTVRIELTGTPTTGYWWYFEPVNHELIELVGEYEEDKSTKNLDGGPLGGIWEFKAKQPGIATIKAVYRRPWETTSDLPEDHFGITLKIVPTGAAPPTN